MKKAYTKRQIQEAISYWEKQLAKGNYKKINEASITDPGYVDPDDGSRYYALVVTVGGRPIEFCCSPVTDGGEEVGFDLRPEGDFFVVPRDRISDQDLADDEGSDMIELGWTFQFMPDGRRSAIPETAYLCRTADEFLHPYEGRGLARFRRARAVVDDDAQTVTYAF